MIPSLLTRPGQSQNTCDGLFLIYIYLPHLLPTCICPTPHDCCGSDSLSDFLATSWSMPETRTRNWSLLTVFRKVRMVLRNLFSVFFRAQRTSHVSEKYQGCNLLLVTRHKSLPNAKCQCQSLRK